MKVEQVVEQMKQNNLLDEQEVYVYASIQGILGSITGKVQEVVILSVYGKLLYIHRAKMDNTYGDQLAVISIPDMSKIQGKAGLFGGKFSFEYKGRTYRLKLPSKANKFVEYFTDQQNH